VPIKAMITAIRASQNNVRMIVAATNTITMAPMTISSARSMLTTLRRRRLGLLAGRPGSQYNAR
jgi:hypothetical protein